MASCTAPTTAWSANGFRTTEVAPASTARSAIPPALVVVTGERDDRYLALVEDAACRLDPVESRQGKVEHDHVGLVQAGELDGLDAVAGVFADVESSVLEHESQVGANDRVIIDGQDRRSSNVSWCVSSRMGHRATKKASGAYPRLRGRIGRRSSTISPDRLAEAGEAGGYLVERQAVDREPASSGDTGLVGYGSSEASRSSTETSGSDSIFELPRAPSATETFAIVRSSGASTTLTKS